MAPWTSPPRGLSQVSLVVREAAGGAWSLAEHFPERHFTSPGSLLQLGRQSSVRDTLRGGLAAALASPLLGPGICAVVTTSTKRPPPPPVPRQPAGLRSPGGVPAVWGRGGPAGEGWTRTVAAETAAFTLSPLIPISWLLALAETDWKPQRTRILQVPPAAADTS